MADKPAEIRTTLEQLLSEKQREKVLAPLYGALEQNPLFPQVNPARELCLRDGGCLRVFAKG